MNNKHPLAGHSTNIGPIERVQREIRVMTLSQLRAVRALVCKEYESKIQEEEAKGRRYSEQ